MKFRTHCVELYEKVARECGYAGYQCQFAYTPFIDEDQELNPTRDSVLGYRSDLSGGGFVCPGCCEAFPVETFKEAKSATDAVRLCRCVISRPQVCSSPP